MVAIHIGTPPSTSLHYTISLRCLISVSSQNVAAAYFSQYENPEATGLAQTTNTMDFD